MRHLDLFSGIGGFALSAQWVWGEQHEIISFCEIDPFCQKVLKKHWPDVPCCEDIRELTLDRLVSSCYNKETNFIMETDMKNYSEAVKMYEKGLSIQNVADYYGITRQAMWDILKRRGCRFRNNLRFGKENHFHRGTSADDKAQNILEQAIESGIITRKVKCENCGDTGTFKDGRTAIQAHHCDYNKPLEVLWLCQKCHHSWHKNKQAIPRKEETKKEANCQIDLLTGGFP